MDVEAIVRRVDEDLATAEAQLRAALGRVEEAQKRVSELTQLRDGFVRTIERYGEVTPTGEAEASAPAESPGGEPVPHPWLALGQTDAVLAALAEIGRPATTTEIYDRLVKAGRTEGPEQVRSAVGYLHRRAKKVDRMARGLWELPGGSDSPAATEVPSSSNGHANGGGLQ